MSGLGDQRFEANPAMLKSADHGYVLEETRSSKVSREKTIKGQTIKVTIISKLAGYEGKAIGGQTPFTDQASLGLVSTPAAEVQGVAVNPVAEKPLKDLVTGKVGEAFMSQVDLGDASWEDGPKQVDSRSGKLLGKSAEVKTFAGTTSEGEFVLLNAARVTDGDDAILVGDSRSKSPSQLKKRFIGENGYISQAELDESGELFVAVLPYVIHGEGVDFPTVTGTPDGTPAGETAPIFEVTARGAPRQAAETLGDELGVAIPGDGNYYSENGVIQYVDDEAYMHVPMETSASGTDDAEQGGRDASMVLQMDALEELPEPPNADEMLGKFQQALDSAGLHPEDDWPGTIETSTSHASFGLANQETGNTELERDLDTAAYLRPRLDGHAVEGPGAKIRARFADLGSGPVLSDLRYSFRGVRSTGTQVTLLSESAAMDRYRKRIQNTVDAESVEPTVERLVYLAPELDRSTTGEDAVLVGSGSNEVSELLPHYVVGGTAAMGGQQVELVREFIPATDDERFVPIPPEIVDAGTDGSQVSVSANLSGGRRPYTVEVSVADGSLRGLEQTGSDPPEFTGTLSTRSNVSETTLTLKVTDANGATARSTTTISVDADAAVGSAVSGGGLGGGGLVDSGHGVNANPTSGAVPGTADVGSEGTDFVNWADNYVAAARALGISVNNTWMGNDVWEKDFLDTTDSNYGIDTADHTVTVAHGNPMGFAIPNNNHDDGFVHHTDANEDWGNHDLEWHTLVSCNVLAPDDGKCGGCNNKSRIERWWQEFDELHQIQGFQTLGYVVGGFMGALAKYVFGPSIIPARKMRTAWFLAIDNFQPGPKKNQAWKKRGVVMGPMDANRNCTIDDHFWGRGSVGPDIRHEDVRYIYWFVGATGGG